MIINAEKEFEEMLIALEENNTPGIREATVFMFYSKVASLEKKAAKNNNNHVQ